MNNSLHLWSEKISLTEEWISLDSNSSRVKRFHSLRSEFHSILTPVEWKFTTQRVKSLPVHSIFTPKEVITLIRYYPYENKVNWVFFLKSDHLPTIIIGVWDQFHLGGGGGLRSVARIFYPLLEMKWNENQVVLPKYYIFGPPPPPPPRLVRLCPLCYINL